jgi:hypothetical protein
VKPGFVITRHAIGPESFAGLQPGRFGSGRTHPVAVIMLLPDKTPESKDHYINIIGFEVLDGG